MLSRTYEADREAVKLTKKMEDVLEVTLTAEKLRSGNEIVKKNIKSLFNQLIECFIFLYEYSRKEFAGV